MQGYLNLFVRAQVVTPGSGKVNISPVGASSSFVSYKETFDFQTTSFVASELVYFQAKAKTADGYFFAGWYLDSDDDGQFNPNIDELISLQEEDILFAPAGSLLPAGMDDYYPTEADAKNATNKPTSPNIMIFAFFSDGVSVSLDHNMHSYRSYVNDDGQTDYAVLPFGTVSIDKVLNSVGDQVTIKAVPAEGYKFDYWKKNFSTTIYTGDADVFSTQAEVTFIVSERTNLYAVFSQLDAPYVDFPEQGGWKALKFNGPWILHEQSNAQTFLFTLADIKLDANGQAYFDVTDEDAWYDNTMSYNDSYGRAKDVTLMYGRGRVRTAYLNSYGFSRANRIDILFTGNNGGTINDSNNANSYHVYAFDEEKQAFVEIGNTDMYINPNAPTSVFVPANTAYMYLSAFDLSNQLGGVGELPDIIYLPHDAFDNGMTYEKTAEYTSIQDINQKLSNVHRNEDAYTLSGARIQHITRPGLYIVAGRKVYVK